MKDKSEDNYKSEDKPMDKCIDRWKVSDKCEGQNKGEATTSGTDEPGDNNYVRGKLEVKMKGKSEDNYKSEDKPMDKCIDRWKSDKMADRTEEERADEDSDVFDEGDEYVTMTNVGLILKRREDKFKTAIFGEIQEFLKNFQNQDENKGQIGKD
ncbi:unnamed protein product [Mytilus coruscus]|uniref:Uncharacterized protein n=1 Tax=Mytilus coruscus TaxID=42192 RepID=A0A6J8DHZ1_MYTCO|nr:unnamed protein product [Mytilus coruscus]